MAKFDPFRQNMPQNPQPGPPYPAPQGYPPGQYPPPPVPQPGYPSAPGYGQPAYGQPAYSPPPPPQPAPGYGQPYAMPQQPAFPPAPQPAYFPPQPQPQPVAYGQPQFPQQGYPSPYAPPPAPAPVAFAPPPQPVPMAYAPQPVPVPMPQPVPMPKPVPVPQQPTFAAPDLPMSARANPMAPAAPVAPVTVKPVAPKPVAAVAPVAAPRPVQPTALQPKPVPAPAHPAAKPVGQATNRPIVAPAKPKDAKPKVETEPAEAAPPPDPTDKVVKGAPPWMISLVVHMVLLIVLALIGFVVSQPNQIFLQVETVYAEELGEQIIEQELQSPEFENMEIESPALSFDVKPADDPLAAPPILEMTSVDATDSVDTIEAPSIGLALNGREAGSKRALLAAYGGNATTEAAVELGLQWLKKQQMQDGSWSLTGPFSEAAGVDNKVSATAMALLAFQGAGHTHKTGTHKAVVEKGWKALKAYQNADGLFVCDAAHHHRLYAQAQATIAACEIYGMTKDEAYRPMAQKAIDYAIFAQAPEGGWRYEPKIDSDTSVTGWFVMAMQSGMMAGLDVPSPNVSLTDKFLDSVQQNGGSHYMYKPGMEQTLTMTAEGLLCRMYLGWKHDDPRLTTGMDYVCGNTINYGDVNVYYWYYATQAAHHMGGHHWKQWNQVMIQTVPKAQIKTGAEAGSWSPSGDRWGTHGGRLFSTCLSIYMLEAYYRHMPLYKHRIEMPKELKAGMDKALNASSK